MKITKNNLTYDTETGKFYRKNIPAEIDSSFGYFLVSWKGNPIGAHRLAYFFTTDRFPNLHIDHINGDRKDNRWGNLREITQKQNNQCRPAYSKSGYKGVYVDKTKWKAMITVDKKIIYLGRFSEKKDAAMAYDKAAIKYFGSMCKLNFPSE